MPQHLRDELGNDMVLQARQLWQVIAELGRESYRSMWMKSTDNYRSGMWVVHASYGIGKIKRIVKKNISGTPKRYYKIVTENSTYWMPVEQMDSTDIRPITPVEELLKAIAVLEAVPEEMSSDHKVRQKRIQKVLNANAPYLMACMLRDLTAYWREKGPANAHERQAFQSLRGRLAAEWSIAARTNQDDTVRKINIALGLHQSSSSEEVAPSPFGKEMKRQKSADQGKKWMVWSGRTGNRISR